MRKPPKRHHATCKHEAVELSERCATVEATGFPSPDKGFRAMLPGIKSSRPSGFYERTRSAKKIVVVDLGFLGDTVHLIPALWEIKRHHPGASLHVVCTPVGAEVLQLAPCVDRAWPVELDPRKRTLGQQWRLIWALRREAFDIAFNFSGADRATILAGLSGARWRAGHPGGREHFWNSWLVSEWSPRQDPDLTVFEQRRQVLAALGFKLEPPRFDLRLEDSAVKWAEAPVPAGAVHLSISSNKPLKEWPLAHYAAMIQAVWRVHPALPVVASTGQKEREQERLRQLTGLIDDLRFQPLPATLSIMQLAAALKRCRLQVGSDSGVMHLAVALGVPTLSFFREQQGYKSWLPTGAGHRILSAPCACVDQSRAPCESSERAECLARLEPARAAEIICQECLARCPTVP